MQENNVIEIDLNGFLLKNSIEIIYKELQNILSTYSHIKAENNNLQKDINKQNLLVNKLNEQVKDIQNKIILSTDNCNKNGRPSLSIEDIQFIKDLRKKGMTQRQVAEYMSIGNGTVAKYDKLEINESNQSITPSNVFGKI